MNMLTVIFVGSLLFKGYFVPQLHATQASESLLAKIEASTQSNSSSNSDESNRSFSSRVDHLHEEIDALYASLPFLKNKSDIDAETISHLEELIDRVSDLAEEAKMHLGVQENIDLDILL